MFFVVLPLISKEHAGRRMTNCLMLIMHEDRGQLWCYTLGDLELKGDFGLHDEQQHFLLQDTHFVCQKLVAIQFSTI